MIAGFRRFREKYFQGDAHEHSMYQRLTSSGQTPKTLLIGCSGSRVDPALMTGASPGDLFVIRNVANLVPPCEPANVGLHGTSSAIEFAVTGLKVENIIVLGHRQCGGIRALMTGNTEEPHTFVGKWMMIAKEARERIDREHPGLDEEQRCRLGEKEAILVSLKNLRTFPFVEEAIKSRNMNLIGVYFDLERGELWEYNDTTRSFRQLEI
ncbi:MAG TPA: carbonic anhydrase [Pseudobdellovibrionaceae bacterium]|nr:carbonic anhydrase [Pseudobdellovibrionaceae bacterium]